jgi:hypothetical protein
LAAGKAAIHYLQFTGNMASTYNEGQEGKRTVMSLVELFMPSIERINDLMADYPQGTFEFLMKDGKLCVNIDVTPLEHRAEALNSLSRANNSTCSGEPMPDPST